MNNVAAQIAFIISFLLFFSIFPPSFLFLPSLSRPFLAYLLPLSCSLQKPLWSTSNATLHLLIAAFSNIHSRSLLCCPSHFSWTAPLVQRQFVHIFSCALPPGCASTTPGTNGTAGTLIWLPSCWLISPQSVAALLSLLAAAISFLRVWYYLGWRPPLPSVFMWSLIKQNSASFFGLQELWY